MLTLDSYWSAVADRFDLDLSEREALAAHLAGVDESDWTAATTSASIVADALAPGLMAARMAEESARNAVADAWPGADLTPDMLSFGVVGDGVAVMRAYASTSDYMLTCVSTGERDAYLINREHYATWHTIPRTYRKACRIAGQFAGSHRTGLIRDAIAAHVNAETLYQRWRAISCAA